MHKKTMENNFTEKFNQEPILYDQITNRPCLTHLKKKTSTFNPNNQDGTNQISKILEKEDAETHKNDTYHMKTHQRNEVKL